jgi:hypothetical protein
MNRPDPVSRFLQSAFSDLFTTSGDNFFLMFLIDLMHEVEIGSWKALFIHLLQILASVDESTLHELDRR